jgi:hypothetical protein
MVAHVLFVSASLRAIFLHLHIVVRFGGQFMPQTKVFVFELILKYAKKIAKNTKILNVLLGTMQTRSF